MMMKSLTTTLLCLSSSLTVSAAGTDQPGWLVAFFKWWPDQSTFMAELHEPMLKWEDTPDHQKGDPALRAIFDAWPTTAWFQNNWLIPLSTCAVYVVSVKFILPSFMKKREKMLPRMLGVVWNLFLSGFSAVGLYYTAPTLLSKVMGDGFQGSVCGPPFEYGHGMCGLFVMAFIVSKLFEVVDTYLLIINKKPVILLHWYHHATVMLYTWHAYSVRSGFAGLWFAVMNYFVHTIMYFYYAMMMYSKGTAKIAKQFNIYITSLQIAQMVMGMVVLMKTISVQMYGGTCYMNRSNQILGFIMYASYFLLFGKLFIDYYILGDGGKQKTQ